MGTVHDLLERQGKKGAIEAGLGRELVEAAASYMSDEDAGLGFVYSGWAQCALPHRRLADEKPWQIVSERVRLVVEPGRRPGGENGDDLEFLGVPYGSHARLILLFLQTEALRTGLREVELGRSMRQWLERMGVAWGGTSGRSVRDQAERISRCRLTFHLHGAAGKTGLVNQAIVDRALFIEEPGDQRQGRLNLETAKLSEGFFEQLKKHPVPLEEAAVRAICNNPAALEAASYMSDEDAGLGFVYSGWAQCALPHRRLADEKPWQIVSERVVNRHRLMRSDLATDRV
jgi:Plasmid encoded RepA protein